MQKVGFKEINTIAIPAIIAGIAEPVLSLTDIAILGNVNENPIEALAAVGIVGSFLSAIIWIVAQTKTSISAIVSQRLGQNRIKSIKTLIPQVIFFNLLLSLLIYPSTAFFAKYIFIAYSADGLILDYAVEYYRIRAIGFPFTLVTFAIFGVFRGIQNTIWAMKCSLTGAAINIVLSYILVYGIKGWFNGSHILGAAWASLAAQLCMLLMALYYFFTKTTFHLKLSKHINPEMKSLLLMSGNLFLRTLSLNIAIYLANTYATGYGNSHIAAQSIVMNIWLFFSFFIDGYANAGNAIAGKLLGEKSYFKLWKLSIDISKYAVGIALVLILICALLYNQIGLIFTKEEAVLSLFESIFWMVLLMQPINAIAFMFDGIFKGMGKAKYLRNVLLIATFLGFIPTLLVTDYFGLQLYGIWIAFFVWMVLRAVILVYKFKNNYVTKAKKENEVQA